MKFKTLRRGIVSALAAMLLAVSIAGPVSANHTTNYAGRPLADSTGGSEDPNESKCHGLAYGYVDGKKVLFIANHCVNTRFGVGIYGPYNYQIGTTPSSQAHVSTAHDLAFIWLTWGFPTNPHQIYAGYVNGVGPKWATNTYKLGSSSWSCSGMLSRVGYSTYEFHNEYFTGTDTPKFGTMTERYGACQIRTTHKGTHLFRHSGAPLMNVRYDQSGAIIGVGTGRVCYEGDSQTACTLFGPNDLLFSSVYEGMQDIRQYWLTHGTKQGAYFCASTAACTAP